MSAVEAEGRTIEEAIASALQQLRADRDQVEIEILSQATKGFLGIGGKKARVRATLRVPLSVRPVEPEPAPTRGRTERARRAENVPREIGDEDEAALPSTESGEKANTMLKEMIRLMGMEAVTSLSIRDGEAVISIAGPAANTLIGHRGQTLDALEYLLNRIITRSDEGEARLTLDAEGYRERRRKSLESLALRLGERAKRRRKPVTLSPLSPRDRRVVHLALQDDPLVTTRSSGRGYFRRLSIVPEGGPQRERGRGFHRAQGAE
jgi:spoIIIJ-associated protein